MKNIIRAIVVLVALTIFPQFAQAWNCTQAGQIRVQVPSGTIGSGQGDGPGQVVTVEGITFQCQTPPAPPTSTGGNSNATSQSTSSSNSAANSISGSSSQSSATGGSASSKSNATGGNATGGSATATGGSGGNATSNQTQSQTVANSGNSSSSSSNNSSGNNTTVATTDVTSVRNPAATAYAPMITPTSPCFKGYSGAAQTQAFGLSIGGGRIDAGCDIRETARLLAGMGSREAACKLLITEPSAKKAGLTLEDCLVTVVVDEHVEPSAPVPAPTPIVVTAPPVTVNVPAPIIQVQAPVPAPVLPPAKITPARVKWVPFNNKYVVGQKLVVVGPLEGLCNAIENLIQIGVPRSAISGRTSDKDAKVRVYVIETQESK